MILLCFSVIMTTLFYGRNLHSLAELSLFNAEINCFDVHFHITAGVNAGLRILLTNATSIYVVSSLCMLWNLTEVSNGLG